MIHCPGLEQLPNLVEEHDKHRLGKRARHKSSHGGQGHEKVFVKHLPVPDVSRRPIKYIPPHGQIGNQVEQRGQQCRKLRRVAQQRHQRQAPGGGQNPQQYRSLFVGQRLQKRGHKNLLHPTQARNPLRYP